MTAAVATLSGGCHCGRIRVAFATTLEPRELAPRACDCDFCRKHGAAWISDPAGSLRVEAEPASALRSYRQGSETARLLLCAHCGVVVAVGYAEQGRIWAAVNAGCLDDATALAGAVPASPQQLTAEQKVERWRQLWIADVQLPVSIDAL
ncbi:GFA family protein [Marilutibacter maris]|uniref:CENP-V/GFA domain-containing protein n=1 Tax=Marilutibacter maris TaxID=1605891 RepID=A0A2U9T8B4_9GAMM|nr:GFA family protein [Lysobacter maris]AWV07812.1 hypothetical protein C9I47_2129 [Lysobacter maris]